MNQTPQASNLVAPTQYATAGKFTYAYRRFGQSRGLPLLCLQHFTGTLDGWDPAVTDELARGREVILFESAGIGRSTGQTPDTVEGMADHAMAFLDALGLAQVDVLGFSLGGMVAQIIARRRPSLLRRIILAGTGPEGGEGTAMDRPELLTVFVDQAMPMHEKLVRLFFEPTQSGQVAGREFVNRLAQRVEGREPVATGEVAVAQLAAMSTWEKTKDETFASLREITHPVLVTNGDNDTMIPTANSFVLQAHLPDAQLIIYPNSGHGALFQHAAAFTSHAAEFLDRTSR